MLVAEFPQILEHHQSDSLIYNEIKGIHFLSSSEISLDLRQSLFLKCFLASALTLAFHPQSGMVFSALLFLSFLFFNNSPLLEPKAEDRGKVDV